MELVEVEATVVLMGRQHLKCEGFGALALWNGRAVVPIDFARALEEQGLAHRVCPVVIVE